MKEERLYQIIKTVMVTEKTSKAAQYNQIVIQVDKKATKDEIKAAVESLLGEKVIAVNTVNQKGKTHTFSNLSVTKNVETKSFDIGSTYTFPSFSVAGHTFTGWYTSLTGGNRVESNTVVSNTTNHT